VFASLEQALAIYGAGKGGINPVKDKKELVQALREALSEATSFCLSQGVDLNAWEALPTNNMDRLAALEKATNNLISPDAVRQEFLGHEKLVTTLYNAIKPDPTVVEFAPRVMALVTLANEIKLQLNPSGTDISHILGQITQLLDDSIKGTFIKEAGPDPIDLSKINFEALAQRFKDSQRKNTTLEALKAAIGAKLQKLVLINRTRTNFFEIFEELIESYNNGSRNIEQLFEELLNLSQSLNAEEERHVRENLTEEELVLFDILTRPAPQLTEAERSEIKKVTKLLHQRIKELLVIDWRQKASALSSLKLAIQDTLDLGLPESYSRDIFNQKCTALFEHVYESYPGKDTSIYAKAI